MLSCNIMEKEKVRLEWKADFVDIVLKHYNLKQEPIKVKINLRNIAKNYNSLSTKARKNRRKQVRDAMTSNTLKPYILIDLLNKEVKNVNFPDTETLIKSCSHLIYFIKENWWEVIKRNNLEKDFIWEDYKQSEGGGWYTNTTRVIHKDLNIYYV